MIRYRPVDRLEPLSKMRIGWQVFSPDEILAQLIYFRFCRFCGFLGLGYAILTVKTIIFIVIVVNRLRVDYPFARLV
jgi:hypothetical protein